MTRLSLAGALVDASVDSATAFIDNCQSLGLHEDDEVVLALTPAAGVSEAALSAIAEGQARVRLVVAPRGTSLLHLWGKAMAASEGASVAVIDARDRLGGEWLQAFTEAQSGRIVCGPVNPPARGSSAGLAAYLSEYGQFQAPLTRSTMEEYPGNNIVFPRSLLPADESLEKDGFFKTFHVEDLKGRLGELPIDVDNRLAVQFNRDYSLPAYLKRRVIHGRCYGGKRLQQDNHPPRLMCLAFTPLLPSLRTWRVIRRTARKPKAAALFKKAAVGLVLGEVAWAAGEALGYALGAGDCCSRIE